MLLWVSSQDEPGRKCGDRGGSRGSLTPMGRLVVKRKIDDSGNESSRNGRYATRTATKATPAKESGCTTDARNEINDGGHGGATLKHVSHPLGDCRTEFAGFKRMIRSQSELIRTQQETIQDLKEASESSKGSSET